MDLSVRCVLEKTVVTDGTEPDKQLAGIQLVHHHGPPPQDVGRSPEERDANFQKMLATPDGQKLTPEKVEQIREPPGSGFLAIDFFGTFQAKSDRQLADRGTDLSRRQPAGPVFGASQRMDNGVGGSMWQRDASLTVYVPSCTAVGIHGGSGVLTAEDLHTTLIVRGDGNRDFDSRSHVKNHDGHVTIENIALDRLENVKGIRSAHDYFAPREFLDGHADGGVTLDRSHLVRMSIAISRETSRRTAASQVDPLRGAGPTRRDKRFRRHRLVVRGPLSPAVHQIFSESGSIRLRLSKDALNKAPLLAVTECGTVRVLRDGPPLKDGNLSFLTDDTERRSAIVASQPKMPAISAHSTDCDRPNRFSTTLSGSAEAPGLDVINRAGTIEIGPLDE